MGRSISLSSLAIAIVFLMGSTFCLADNIVVNGTFDNTSSWTGSFTAQSGPGGGFPVLDTQPYYWGGNNAGNSIIQVYDLTPAEQASPLNYVMSGDLFGFSTQQDFSTIAAEFFDGAGATGSTLGSVSLTSTDGDPGTWPDPLTAGLAPSFQATSGSVPSATQSILLTVSSNRTTGTANDGYADNFVLDLQAVPEPGTAALAIFALAGLAVTSSRRWRRRMPA